jgi:hypothetical protein
MRQVIRAPAALRRYMGHKEILAIAHVLVTD